MKLHFSVFTRPESLELEDSIENLLEDNGILEEVEGAIASILEGYLRNPWHTRVLVERIDETGRVT
jgi:hypothetical protein